MIVVVRKFPKSLVWAVVVLTILPWVLNWIGVDFSAIPDNDPEATARANFENNPASDGSAQSTENLQALPGQTVPDPLEVSTLKSTGQSIHTIMEWTAFCIALFTVVLALTHYTIEGDVTTPIIGAALFFTGVLDAFRTIAADGLIVITTPLEEFIPFTWAVSQLFNVSILLLGTGYFLYSERGMRHRPRTGEIRIILLMGILFGMLAYVIIHGCAFSERLPKVVYPEKFATRPLDAIPLVLYLLAGGIVLPRFHRRHPSLFSRGLIVSVIPLVAAEMTVTFGSIQLYDNHFNIALYHKILGYLVPLTGLILDYASAYRAEAVLRATAEQLRIAHQIQQGLLPKQAPRIAGFDVAGVSFHTEEVGGDYFDYIPLAEGKLGIVVADVSGHDLGASLLMSQTRAYLRALTLSRKSVRELIFEVNRFLIEDVHDRRFVSLFFGELDPSQRSLEYSAAGQQGYILTPTGSWQTLDVTDPLLGVTDISLETTVAPVRFQKGDIFLTLTDGIVEALSPAGEQFGFPRVQEIVAKHRAFSAEQIVRELHKAVKNYTGLSTQTDDVTLVIFKVL
ncbi:MAG: PP2C family protein-serine/threonine phosphatase [Planctomycetaceae bacterium]